MSFMSMSKSSIRSSLFSNQRPAYMRAITAMVQPIHVIAWCSCCIGRRNSTGNRTEPVDRRRGAEAAYKLDTPGGWRSITTGLHAADIQGRARAFQSMVSAGMSVERGRRCPVLWSRKNRSRKPNIRASTAFASRALTKDRVPSLCGDHGAGILGFSR